MPRYRYITKIPDFELSRLIPGRPEVLNEGDEFETDLQISASIIERIADDIHAALPAEVSKEIPAGAD